MWLHHPYLLGVTIVGRDQYGYITLAFLGPQGGEKSIWRHSPCILGVPMVGEIHLERSECGGNEQKMCEKGW